MSLSRTTHSQGRWLALCLAAAWLGCAGGTGCRKLPAGPPSVVLSGHDGQPVGVRVEVVRQPEEQARGLMFREHLDADAGMLFVYQAEIQRHFWMKNTYLPLDIAFVGANRRIVGIVANAQPLTTSRREVDAPSQYVLETNAGFFHKHGVRIGSLVRFENIPGLSP
jgi:uncharacterized membrane protein (UPF0127 family)